MRVLEPIEQSAIPFAKAGTGRMSKFRPLYDQVLSLNGKALPVEFDSPGDADRKAKAWRQRVSTCYKLGIRVTLRGNVVYLVKGQ